MSHKNRSILVLLIILILSIVIGYFIWQKSNDFSSTGQVIDELTIKSHQEANNYLEKRGFVLINKNNYTNSWENDVVEPIVNGSSFFENKKIIILNFWKSSCIPCVEEIASLNILQQQYNQKIAVKLLNFNDSQKEQLAFIEQLNVNLENQVINTQYHAQVLNYLSLPVNQDIFPQTLVLNANKEPLAFLWGSINWQQQQVIDSLLWLG